MFQLRLECRGVAEPPRLTRRAPHHAPQRRRQQLAALAAQIVAPLALLRLTFAHQAPLLAQTPALIAQRLVDSIVIVRRQGAIHRRRLVAQGHQIVQQRRALLRVAQPRKARRPPRQHLVGIAQITIQIVPTPDQALGAGDVAKRARMGIARAPRQRVHHPPQRRAGGPHRPRRGQIVTGGALLRQGATAIIIGWRRTADHLRGLLAPLLLDGAEAQRQRREQHDGHDHREDVAILVHRARPSSRAPA
ncbi:hypothetical protein MAIT1_00420 [Magnetofaba australis IT-1]|uniref:Uncharacterized protein n=1 Tax=Magnetofaba australis IT-1 TaxID=1434232 RepID=A0A1Y2JYQ4_9PROT|nr:hypothetical protein MAIT1_00420 [Magnetofaba australis IT-1]